MNATLFDAKALIILTVIVGVVLLVVKLIYRNRRKLALSAADDSEHIYMEMPIIDSPIVQGHSVTVRTEYRVNHAEEQEHKYLSPGQGKRTNYILFCHDGQMLGKVETEVWSDEHLILVHRIDAAIPRQGMGTAMVEWFVENHCGLIQPVHVIHNGMGFWYKLNKRWPERIAVKDLRCSEYLERLASRKAKLNLPPPWENWRQHETGN